MKTIALQVAKTTPGQLAFHAYRVRPGIGFDRCREFHGPAATSTRGPNGSTFLLAILEAHHPLHVPFPPPPLSIERTPTRDGIRSVSAPLRETSPSGLTVPGRARDATPLPSSGGARRLPVPRTQPP